MTRTLAHSLSNLSREKKWDFQLWSVYDSRYDLMEQYLPPENYVGFGRNKVKLGLKTLSLAARSDIVILSHINLALLGAMIKVFNPHCKIWLVAHGIEVWRPLSLVKKLLVTHLCSKIICVSTFTKQQMIKWHNAEAEKCIVLNNAVDPFIKLPNEFSKPDYLLNRYSLTAGNKVLFTLTRLASSEQYKGYEQVIKAVSRLKVQFPTLKYLLAGPYDPAEEIRIKELIRAYRVDEEVILTGFLHENELADHFLLADLFVLPSKKEGFGIVFVEALACGLPVICGNADGSTDAIRNGELGTAINVDDLEELEHTITGYLKTPLTIAVRQHLQQECLRHFNEQDYQKNLQKLIEDE